MPVTVFQGRFKKGEVIAGRYRILRKLGAGGAGSVYHCRDQRQDREVAIKILENPADVGRFRREARVMKGVNHPHVLRLYASGTHDKQVPFLVLEYMEGGSLRQYMDRKKRLRPEEAAWVAIMAVRGLRAVRTVHRDLKPENLLIALPEGVRGVRFTPDEPESSAIIKVADFGLAKATQGSNETSLTRTAAVMGTPTYMSPEQCRSTKNVSFKTDIYAMGCILVEMVSGTPPYDANNVYDIMAMHCSDEVQPKLGNMPKSLRPIVLRCLEKTVGKRYRSMKALEDDLAKVAGVDQDSGRSSLWALWLLLILVVAAAVAGWWYFDQLQAWYQGLRT